MTLSIIGQAALSLAALLSFAAAAAAKPPPPESCLVYVGTYTNNGSKGIYAWRMDSATGSLTPLGLVGTTANPSFLDVSPDRRFLYAVNEIGRFDGKSAGSVSAFSIAAASGQLTLLNQQTSGGPGPCHLAVDHTGKYIIVANYDGGSVECLPIQSNGRLGAPTAFIQHNGKGINPSRQEGPHAHCIAFDPSNHFVFVCDLGLDKIMSYAFDPAKGTLTPDSPGYTATAAGAGPRHLIFDPNRNQAYAINELNSTIARYAFDPPHALLTALQTVPLLPPQFTGTSTAAEIVLHPSGRFLYGSNRGDDSIVLLSIDAAGGALKYVERFPSGGKTPRNIAIDPSGKYLFAANQTSGNIVVFNVDAASGKLTPSGKVLELASPVCVKFVPIPSAP